MYEVVNGEYELTKELDYEIGIGEGDSFLYYYEMGELMRTHLITKGEDEVCALYPDLDYWLKG